LQISIGAITLNISNAELWFLKSALRRIARHMHTQFSVESTNADPVRTSDQGTPPPPNVTPYYVAFLGNT